MAKYESIETVTLSKYVAKYESIETVTLSKYVAKHELQNLCLNFSASFRVAALKLLELIRFALTTIIFLKYLSNLSHASAVIVSRFLWAHFRTPCVVYNIYVGYDLLLEKFYQQFLPTCSDNHPTNFG